MEWKHATANKETYEMMAGKRPVSSVLNSDGTGGNYSINENGELLEHGVLTNTKREYNENSFGGASLAFATTVAYSPNPVGKRIKAPLALGALIVGGIYTYYNLESSISTTVTTTAITKKVYLPLTFSTGRDYVGDLGIPKRLPLRDRTHLVYEIYAVDKFTGFETHMKYGISGMYDFAQRPLIQTAALNSGRKLVFGFDNNIVTFSWRIQYIMPDRQSALFMEQSLVDMKYAVTRKVAPLQFLPLPTPLKLVK